METQYQNRLIRTLQSQNILSDEQAANYIELYKNNNQQLLKALVRDGTVSDSDLAEQLARTHNVPFTDLSNFRIEPEITRLIPPSLALKHEVLPIALEGIRLVLASADPTDVAALDEVAAATGLLVTPVVTTRAGIQAALNKYIRADSELSDLSAAMAQDARATSISPDTVDDADEDAPIVRFVSLLISQAIQDRASDIHIEPFEHQLRVRFRIDGVLHEVQQAPISIRDGVISRLKIMSDIDIAERRRPQDGRISVSHLGRKVDLRVATLPTVWGEKVVLRILDNSDQGLNLKDLAFSASNRTLYEENIRKPNGMVLITGPTGSGKSTTMYATLQAISSPTVNVITVEDPVEYRIPSINQIQVNQKAGMTFSSALRSILRADPDIIMLGEIRDRETAAIAIEAALTGHLVFSTLHTNDAPSSVTRLVDMGIEPFLVGASLEVVVAQRLARKLCNRCKEPAAIDEETLRHLGFSNLLLQHPGATIFQAKGCSHCSNTGYRGRLALHEIMGVNEEIQHRIVADGTHTSIRDLAIGQGMVPLREDGWMKVLSGETSIEEVLRVVV